MKLLLGLFIVFYSVTTWSLEVDEKLTLRIVKTSESKKTILINRGIEDGLAKGDHAKFYLSIGVVARGVVIKASPTRSVWSIYRLVNSEYIKNDQVMKIKITPAVKVTKDESRMLVSDAKVVRDPRELGIPLADGADDLSLESGTSKIANTTTTSWFDEGRDLLRNNLEVFGSFNYSSYGEEVSPSDSGDKFTATTTNMALTLGGEWYPASETSWLSRFSALSYLKMMKTTVMAYQGATVKETANQFGFGANFHPLARPSKVYTFIPYLNATFIMGSLTSGYKSGNEGGPSDISLDGSIFSYYFGFGYKFYVPNGFGTRLQAGYTLRTDLFSKEASGTSWQNIKSGPQIEWMLSYRF